MYSEVTGDLQDVAKRLRHINKDYRVFFNNRDYRFEVHTASVPSVWTIAFVVPYEHLDTRTLDYARRTRKENADALEAEVNAHNANLVNSARKDLENVERELGSMMQYAARASHSVIFTKNHIKEF